MATASDMIVAIETALAATPVGLVQVTVDGQTVRYSRGEALDELRYWQRQAARANGSRPVSATINLGGF